MNRAEEKAGRNLLALPVEEFWRKFVLQTGDLDATQLLLALELICELRRGEGGRWWPWINMLPSSPGSLIAAFTQGVLYCALHAATLYTVCNELLQFLHFSALPETAFHAWWLSRTTT